MELETLRSDMIAAMKAKDKARKEAISSLISAAKRLPSTRAAVMTSNRSS